MDEGAFARRELHRGLHPHPRVTAVAKKTQPPRRLPSPATERAKDLQKKEATLSSGRESFRKSRLPDPAPRRERDLQKALTKQGQPLNLRARDLRRSLKQGRCYMLGGRIFRKA